MSPQEIIHSFKLQPHPEGGHFRETYRSRESCPTPRGKRSVSTAILFLLQEGESSHFHRLQSDELWHFHNGGTLEIFELLPGGKLQQTLLGPHFTRGEKPQHLIPQGHWFAARPLPESSYSFVSCTVSPGFEFCDFELATEGKLLQYYPGHQKIIRELTLP